MEDVANALPQMVPVESSNLAEVGYGDDGFLYVRFKGRNGAPGALWRYGVPRMAYDEIVAADSPGTAFNALVKRSCAGERVE